MTPADICFNENGIPISNAFDDIYYSKENGLQESIYVFQEGNDLTERWLAWTSSHFCIAETGFGTGLNFLAVCDSFNSFKINNPDHPLQRLIFISFEKYPLEKKQLAQALQQWPNLATWRERLLKHYPSLLPGPNRLLISDDITLDLWFGDVLEQAPTINSTRQIGTERREGIVDAWFLDGFAPSKNPDMWSETLFGQIARLTKIEGTLSTFTAAGFVRRGLIAQGFTVNKRKGFGHKREMIVGVLTSAAATEKKQSRATIKSNHLHPIPYANNKTQAISIIGGGIAGLCCADALAKRGFKVNVYTSGELADMASGNPQGAIYPLIQLRHNPLSELHIKCFEFASQYYQTKREALTFGFEKCGVIQPAFNEDRARRLKQLSQDQSSPATLVKAVNAEQASELAGIKITDDAWFYPEGGWLNPSSFIQALATDLTQHKNVTIQTQSKIEKISKTDQGWSLWHKNSLINKSEQVVLCNAYEMLDFTQSEGIELYPVRGQVSQLSSSGNLANLKSVICHKGYLTPAWQHKHCAGASFIKGISSLEPTEKEKRANIEQQQSHLQAAEIDFAALHIPNDERVSHRTCTQDHLPIVGPLFDKNTFIRTHHDLWKGQLPKSTVNTLSGLYCISGLAARGLNSAPLLAETIAGMINNEPLPFSQSLLDAFNPNRFLIKNIIRKTI
ncbi:bifunctional tRNA (5-methylaminomethyl-2-thiouridine)(34)-methyltransferase MnmD/FAD-dependent 5-carboxymethylaminomethyl-2-thiouridine(34) oxidoreductase MnmC [Algibacillus agarilyticus]|uniref:bifunctional tRNA (5-methylaminomethyl-2-thiouridine)(34)-methyltransferase MnmD/FAD-dependent 5-carboxymethylaminomethyl-2-thiouridine(34) oxidoreductase MnmC n=1 Tax=Algibacillus agarilyticus TaxID=2234133 RepID=UPI000DCFB939|nr:bifunctional tRNA (5-methylaminomethyl-2-thiouridine)(34)-methyltransferase MnmD/FAD-dependent 5-carboxymethylaminomethyl-2-thiouridine(34) oxidoreductase MnmC [Algibacillus agarilyticus]